MANDESDAVGWVAIDRVLESLYSDQTPFHWAPIQRYLLGGPDPLDGISVYTRNEPLPHWHFVTYGFSELFDKEFSDPAVSGYGFELTFRLRTETFEDPPPIWALNFLQNLARYVFSSGNAFGIGHRMPLNGPIVVGRDTKLWAIAFALDSELGRIETPHGRLQFLQVVGITLDEYCAMQSWDTLRFLDTVAPRLPLLVTALARESLTDDPEIQNALQAGVRNEGSGTARLYVDEARWQVRSNLFRPNQLVVTLGANSARGFGLVLLGRLLHGKNLTLTTGEQHITFTVSEVCSWMEGANSHLTVNLTPQAATELASVVVPKQGDYRIETFPAFELHVVRSEMKDSEGNVVEVIG